MRKARDVPQGLRNIIVVIASMTFGAGETRASAVGQRRRLTGRAASSASPRLAQNSVECQWSCPLYRRSWREAYNSHRHTGARISATVRTANPCRRHHGQRARASRTFRFSTAICCQCPITGQPDRRRTPLQYGAGRCRPAFSPALPQFRIEHPGSWCLVRGSPGSRFCTARPARSE